ncbi:hypothetical protein MASR2M16_30060 [Thauera terpenica]
MQGDLYRFGKAAQGLVGGVVDDFLDDVRRAVGAGVHAGALAHRFQPFQDAEGGFVVLLLGSVLLASHAAGPFGFTKGARIAEAGAV